MIPLMPMCGKLSGAVDSDECFTVGIDITPVCVDGEWFCIPSKELDRLIEEGVFIVTKPRQVGTMTFTSVTRAL